MAKYQSRAKRLETATAQIEEGLSELASLTDEMESWRDNMQGTALENTEKYSRVEETADTLRQSHDDIDNALNELQDVDFPIMYG